MKAELKAKSAMSLTDKWDGENRKRKNFPFCSLFPTLLSWLSTKNNQGKNEFQNPEQGAPVERPLECPFVSNRRPIIHLEMEVIRLLRARRVIRPTEAQDAQEETEKERRIHVTDRLKGGSIILCQSQPLSQTSFTLTWPDNYSCPSKQEHKFDLQTEFNSSILNFVSTPSIYNISETFLNLTTIQNHQGDFVKITKLEILNIYLFLKSDVKYSPAVPQWKEELYLIFFPDLKQLHTFFMNGCLPLSKPQTTLNHENKRIRLRRKV